MGVCESIEDDSVDSGSPNLKDDLDSSFYSGPITPPASPPVLDDNLRPVPLQQSAAQSLQSVTEQALDEAIRGATADKKRIFVCLFASFKEDDPQVRWCPDCVDAEPVIDEAFASAAAECHLIKVDITRNSWKAEPGQAHPYRSEPFKAGGIPTLLVLAADGTIEQRFSEEECLKLDLMKTTFASLEPAR